DQIASLSYAEAPFGIQRHRLDADGYDDTDLWLFPYGLRLYNHFAWRVPIDDTHTRTMGAWADLSAGERPGGDWPVTFSPPPSERGKTPADAIHPIATYRMDRLVFQDWMAVETQGPICHRENERLATADRGVALLRQILKREIEKVQQGLDPMGTLRDPENDTVDTFIQHYIAMMEKFP